MRSCEHYQNLLLDWLYDLVDEAERQELTTHLESCAACQAARRRVERRQQLLALAARHEFPNVRFEAPASAEPATIPLPLAGRRRRPLKWALAASIALVLTSAASWAVVHWHDANRKAEWEVAAALNHYESVRAQLDTLRAERQARLQASHEQLARAQQELSELNRELERKQGEAERALRARRRYVAIVSDGTIQAGAANEYHIETRDLDNHAVPAQLDARVVDRSGKVLYEEKNIHSHGKYRLSLPRNLEVKPQEELYLEVVARGDEGPQAQVRERLRLTRPVYLTHLVTDKPMYQPGQTVHYRSLTLERFTLSPAAEDLFLDFTITDPNGNVIHRHFGNSRLVDSQQREVLGPDRKPIRGIGVGEFTLPADLPGGEYTLTVTEARGRFQPEKRKFLVHQYQMPRLDKTLEFARSSYGPGEEVVAVARAQLAGQRDKPLAGIPVVVTIQIDGQTYNARGEKAEESGLQLKTDASGSVHLRFRLPAQIERGDAILAVRFDDRGGPETILRPIPVVVKKLLIEFFPEGGDLVAGVPNRVYFQARTMLGKPADVRGRIVGSDGRTVAMVETLSDPVQPGANQGMGKFTFEPVAGVSYQLRLESPADIEGTFVLPPVKSDGTVLSVPTGVTSDREPIRVVLHSVEKDRWLLVGAYCRGRLLDQQRVQARKGMATEVLLKPESGVGGVYRITVFEEHPSVEQSPPYLVPVAERLVYRQPAGRLNLEVKPDKPYYVPGDTVKLSFKTTTETGDRAPAVLMAAVVDKSLLTLADEKTARTMPTHFLLTTEVRKPEDLEHADFFLTNHPKAAEALDLLLGTQGWRRFAEQDPGQFYKQHKEDAERVLVTIGQMSPQLRPENAYAQARAKVAEEFAPKFQELQRRIARHAEAIEAIRKDPDLAVKEHELVVEIEEARSAYRAAVGALADREVASRLEVRLATLAAAAVLLLVGLSVPVRAWLRRDHHPSSLSLAVGAASLALCAVLLGYGLMAGLRDADGTQALALVDDPVLPDRKADVELGEENKADQASVGKNQGGVFGAVLRDGGPPTGEAPRLVESAAVAAGQQAVPDRGRESVRGQGAAPASPPSAGRAAGAGLEKQLRSDASRRLQDLAWNKAAEGAQKRLAEGRLRNALGLTASPSGASPAAGKVRKDGHSEQFARPDQDSAPGAANRLDRQSLEKGPGVARDDKNWAYLTAPPLVVREYAHQRVAGGGGLRYDFAETVFWHPVLVLPNGQAEAMFQLGDSITSYQVTLFGHTSDGRLGAATGFIEARKPFTLESKLPVEVTASDRLNVPVTLANNTETIRQARLRIEAPGFHLLDRVDDRLTLRPEQRIRRLLRLQPTVLEGTASLIIHGDSEPFATDAVQRSVTVVPDGFPVVGSYSDLLEKTAQTEIVLPPEMVPGTLKVHVDVYLSTLADLQSGLEGLLREPSGCFEQTSASNYPNLLVLNYLRETHLNRPEVEQQAMALLDRGYHKLIAFECRNPSENKREGYEWFGGTAPPHEALTAYGLMQFRDMSQIYPVDRAMMERTRQYLMSRRDGRGGFLRNPKAVDQFGRAPQDITDAYIVWALTESSRDDDVQRELASLQAKARESKDPYFVALVANSLCNRDQAEAAAGLAANLVKKQTAKGYLDGAETSITGSAGRDLLIETTSLAVLAWLKLNRPEFTPHVQTAIQWLLQQRGGFGNYGSTQATILALKALLAYTKDQKRPVEDGTLTLRLGDQVLGQLVFTKEARDKLSLSVDAPERFLRVGPNPVQLEITGNNVFPFTLRWTYHTRKPESAEKCPVSLTTRLDRDIMQEEETVRLTATLTNRTNRGQGMTVAIIGLPAGLALPPDMKQLRDAVRPRNNGTEPGLISAWETRGRELILYWRDLAPNARIEVNLDLIGRVPGEYRGPASRAYLYYNADHKCWVDPLEVTIVPRLD
ncbi:MAG: MG2 domain-containing protein [Gemmataceae bacterium]|nr:MG2 domain-containing protein [Gemmataceae bacterium]MDW8265636.1 alpha-2-macroglobulin family protein [Gemmataceae bacterium]